MTHSGRDETLPGSGRGRVSSFSPLAVALVVAVVFLLGGAAFDRWDDRVAISYARGEAVGRLSRPRVALENRIAAGFAPLPGLAAMVAMHWGEPDLAGRFDGYAEGLRLEEGSAIRSLQCTEDGIITHVWPLAGNEEALGKDLAADPRAVVRDDYLRAVGPDAPPLALSGPLPLFQGGQGLIGRRRVVLPEGSPVVLVAAVLDLPTVLARSGLTDTLGLRWLLRDEAGQRIAGEPEEAMAALAPVALPVRLGDRDWRLEASPREGWPAMIAPRTRSRRIGILGVVLLAGAFGYLFQSRQRTRLETERLRELHDAEAHFALLFQLVPDGVALIRLADDQYVQVNDAYCVVTGRAREELVGRTVAEVGVWAAPEERARALEIAREHGQLVDFPFVVLRPDGSQRETLVSCREIELDGVAHFLSVVRDVHDRVALERRLVASQRLEAIGRLAGGVAHDFNNLITAIGGYAGLALGELPDGDPRREDIFEIQRASNRAAELTRQLLTFARRQVVMPRRVDLGRLVAGIEPLLARLLGERHHLTVVHEADPVPVLIDPSQLEHALVNLAVNARDAMTGGGEVRIVIGFRDEAPILEVTDTGVGITAAARPHLFEPFYTTKPPGRGTGLGLATVYGIVEQAGGTIEVESVVGEGSTFRIVFPPSGHDLPPDPATPRRELPTGTEHVLVVDDEPQIRDICSRLLRRLGYVVTTANEGAEALAALDRPAEPPIRVVLSDLVMPGLGGLELQATLAATHPGLPVILMSGYSEEVMAIGVGEVPFLPKPFTAEELAVILRETLDGVAPPG